MRGFSPETTLVKAGELWFSREDGRVGKGSGSWMSLTRGLALRDGATSQDDLVGVLGLAQSLDSLQAKASVACIDGQSKATTG